MDRYHINPTTGNPGKCRAKEGNCPFGGVREHYDSKEAASAAYEKEVQAYEKEHWAGEELVGSVLTKEQLAEKRPKRIGVGYVVSVGEDGFIWFNSENEGPDEARERMRGVRIAYSLAHDLRTLKQSHMTPKEFDAWRDSPEVRTSLQSAGIDPDKSYSLLSKSGKALSAILEAQRDPNWLDEDARWRQLVRAAQAKLPKTSSDS